MRAWLLLSVLGAVLLAACFSERSEPAGLGALVDCSLPIDSSTVGNLGVVVIRDFAFHPAELRVRPGTRVTWINCESQANQRMAHTTTADDDTWASPLLPFEGTFSTVLSAAGTFEYHCEPHPAMRARVIVEGAAHAHPAEPGDLRASTARPLRAAPRLGSSAAVY